jgi:hypothetical protein
VSYQKPPNRGTIVLRFFRFAIPAYNALWVADQLHRHSCVSRADLGIWLELLSGEAAVEQTVQRLPASDARLQQASITERPETEPESLELIPNNPSARQLTRVQEEPRSNLPQTLPRAIAEKLGKLKWRLEKLDSVLA